ncbi:MAG: rhomboid family intramembrane serine protease [Candidatus Binataceae bacterium]
MIPLRDSETSHRLTPVNTALIILNFAIYGLEVRLGQNAAPVLSSYAMVPAHIANLGAAGGTTAVWNLATLITSLFLHAGILHVAGNMLYLFIFGPAVEEGLGHARFLLFYVAAGIVAGLALVAMGPESRVAVIGASGAIAGVLGAYFVLHPRGRILTVLIIWSFEVPAAAYLLLWFAAQLFSGIQAGAQGPLMGGVAWWAHVGGFLFGVAAGPLIAQVPVRPAPAKRARRKRA